MSSGSLTVTSRSFAIASGDSASAMPRSAAEIHVLGVDLEVAGLDAGQIEDVVDQAQQRVAVARDDLEILALIGGQRTGDAVTQQCDSASTELSGVRISWLMFATNALLSRSAFNADCDRPIAMP